MLVGELAPDSVRTWTTKVFVNGVDRAVTSVTWDTSMKGDLPDQVAASGGLDGTAGTIRWAPQVAVQDRPDSPWHKPAGWPPSAGDLVRIQVSDGSTTWTRWTGVIDETAGEPGGTMQSTIRDFRDDITGTFTHEALLRHMVPNVEGGSYRSIGLNFWYPLTSALRGAGFCNVPPIEPNSELSIPLQGSAWPEAGNARRVGGAGSVVSPSFYYTDYGYAVGGMDAQYGARLGGSTSEPLQITMVVPPTHGATSSVDVMFTNNILIRFLSSSTRRLVAHMSTSGGGTWEHLDIATLWEADAGDYTVATLLVKDGNWTIRTNGSSVSGTGSQSIPAGTMDSIQMIVPDEGRISGVQVSHPNSSAREFASLDFAPNMRFQASGLASTMDMMPALKGRSIRNLMDELTKATLTAAWWDETGTLILRPSDVLRSTPSSQTIDTMRDITSLSWRDSLLSVRSGVDVKWRDPVISKGREFRLELWRGPEESIVNDENPVKQFVRPEDSGVEQEWFGVDTNVRKLDDSSWGAFNSRRGSYAGLRYEYIAGKNAGAELPTTAASVGVTSHGLYSDSVLITTTAYGIPANVEGIFATSTKATALRSQLRGKALPVVRGMGRGEWANSTESVSTGSGVGSILEHDLGYWGHEYFSGDSVAKRIADFLAPMVGAPHPTISNLGVTYDSRRQLGDVYTLQSEWLGIELKVLVIGIRETHDRNISQSLTVRVITAKSTRPVTYDELAAAWDAGNYSSLQAAWAALTYNDMAGDPLEGAPN